MNANQMVFRYGFYLLIVTLLLFFGLFFIFSTKGSISEAQYFNYSALLNCFVLPGIYAGFALLCIIRGAKIQPLTFPQGWKLAFLPQLIGGLSSLVFIFIFFNTSGSWAEDSLQRGWYELMSSNPNPEFMEKNGDLVKGMTDLKVNMFTWRSFFFSFSMIIFFYFLISSIFAMFLKNRRL